MEQVIFKEEQQYRQPWLLVLLGGVSMYYVYRLIEALLLEKGGDPTHLIVVSVILVLALILLYVMKLETEITKEKITIVFFPILKRRIYWKDIQEAYVRKYGPLSEFGGWGIRFSFKGMAYNIAGDDGLQLKLRNGKKILIGTQKPTELNEALAGLQS